MLANQQNLFVAVQNISMHLLNISTSIQSLTNFFMQRPNESPPAPMQSSHTLSHNVLATNIDKHMSNVTVKTLFHDNSSNNGPAVTQYNMCDGSVLIGDYLPNTSPLTNVDDQACDSILPDPKFQDPGADCFENDTVRQLSRENKDSSSNMLNANFYNEKQIAKKPNPECNLTSSHLPTNVKNNFINETITKIQPITTTVNTVKTLGMPLKFSRIKKKKWKLESNIITNSSMDSPRKKKKKNREQPLQLKTLDTATYVTSTHSEPVHKEEHTVMLFDSQETQIFGDKCALKTKVQTPDASFLISVKKELASTPKNALVGANFSCVTNAGSIPSFSNSFLPPKKRSK
ncbi:uncharacterized protein [Engystomops pustulosus]|uniref:uncharacterized protein n=1 Tax=Engystomops pustulosus TaxID=76066 RepID=UPI003AFA19E3